MHDPTVGIDEHDDEMNEAVHLARTTMSVFLNAFAKPKPTQRFLLKVRFEHDGKFEHIWLADLDLSRIPSAGTVANEPCLPSLTFKQRVQFNPADITDWMFVDDGKLVGGYSTRLLRSRLSPTERVEYDAAAPYKFE